MINYPRYLIEEIFCENECDLEMLKILVNLGFNFSQLEQLSYFEGNWDKLLDYVKPDFSVNMIRLIRDLVYYDKDEEYNLSTQLNDTTINKIRFKEKLKYLSKKQKTVDIDLEDNLEYSNLTESDEAFDMQQVDLLELFSDEFNMDDQDIELYDFQEETYQYDKLDKRLDKLIKFYKMSGYYSNYEVVEPFIYNFGNDLDYYHSKFLANSKIMSKQEENRVFKLSLEDPKYRELFIVNNLRLAFSVSKKYFHRANHLGFDDIIQEATIGVMNAYEKYDPSLGYKFSTYANWHITQKIMRFLGDFNSIIRIPIHQVEQNNKYTIVVDEFYLDNYDYPNLNNEKLSDETFSAEVINKIKSSIFEFVEPSDNYSDYIIEEVQTSEDDFFREFLNLVNEILTDREHHVLTLRFGLFNYNPHTLEEVGTKMGVTRERIRQIESKAIRKLQSNPRMRSLLVKSGYTKGD